MSSEIKIVIEQLDKAIVSLEKAAQQSVDKERMIMDATIQRFEYTFELFWKSLRKKLSEDHGIEVFGPKPVLQNAYSSKLIDNEKMWLSMLDDRNLTSHVYKEELADEIYERIKRYAPFLRSEFNKCFR